MTGLRAILAGQCRPALAAVLGMYLAAAPAHAGCAGVEAIDRCLLGGWKQSGGGAVEWMRRNMPPGMSIPRAQQSEQLVVFNKDGTYWTAPMKGEVTLRMESPDGVIQADGNVEAQASGRWAAADGAFHLCADDQKFNARTRMAAPDGSSHAMPLTPPPATGPVAFGYKCSGDALATVQPVPGIDDPITTQYQRAETQ